VSVVIPELKGELDVEVEVNLYRRKYNGKRRKDTDSFRLVAVYNDEDDAYYIHILRTYRPTYWMQKRSPHSTSRDGTWNSFSKSSRADMPGIS